MMQNQGFTIENHLKEERKNLEAKSLVSKVETPQESTFIEDRDEI